MTSYTPTVTTHELTMLILAIEDRVRVLDDRAKLVAETGDAYDALAQIVESRDEYAALLAKLRRIPANSPELTALLRAGEADRAPIDPTVTNPAATIARATGATAATYIVETVAVDGTRTVDSVDHFRR